MKEGSVSFNELPHPKDLQVFLAVVRKLSFAAAAEELGQSPAYVSKRIGILEASLKTRLFHRTTRKIVLTDDGERTYHRAIRILAEIDDMVDDLTDAQHTPQGHLHICSSFGFGRKHVAPAIAELSTKYADLDVRLDVFDRAVDIIQEGFDLEIRVGEDLPTQHICKMLKRNKRIICAAPEYLARHGEPKTLDDLSKHACLVLRERNSPFGIWSFDGTNKELSLPISGHLSTNHGEIILQWALHGRGIIMRSLWDVKQHLASGKMVQILPEYTQEANIWAVYPTRLSHSAKLRVCVTFLEEYLAS
ncbi:LysR substrate-binding domain-containing protein [Agaribacter flavus]|uniref:LysR substrate-binding domain-containing protein n=1 Tax=Agaribacter flavus TaxID=1902781 RepID=A0ABV7FVB9_9ALTE